MRTVSVHAVGVRRGRVPARELRRIARHVLETESVAFDVGVEVVLADDVAVRELNRLYRGRDEPTDVLSFATLDLTPSAPLSVHGKGDGRGEVSPIHGVARNTAASTASDRIPFIEPPEESPSIGEVIVCLPVAEAQAGVAGRAVAGEVAHLLVHGLLHLLGYDHEEDGESDQMKSREDELLNDLGYAGGYEHGH